MTPLTVGIDIADIAPIRRMLAGHGERLLRRVYTAQEQQLCRGRAGPLAALFAAKEAAAKALGVGLAHMAPGGVEPSELEISADGPRRLRLTLHGAAHARAEALGLRAWSLSAAWTRSHAIALAVGWGPGADSP